MRLSAYLAKHHLSYREFAELVGVSDEAVRRYVSGERFPMLDVLHRIAKATRGQVTANDFVADAARAAE